MGTLTGVYDADSKIFEHSGPKELANLRATSKETKANVDKFVNNLVAHSKLVYTATFQGGKMTDWDVKGTNAHKNNPAEVLKLWGTGQIRKK